MFKKKQGLKVLPMYEYYICIKCIEGINHTIYNTSKELYKTYYDDLMYWFLNGSTGSFNVVTPNSEIIIKRDKIITISRTIKEL